MATVQLLQQTLALRNPEVWDWDDSRAIGAGISWTQPVDEVLALLEPGSTWRAPYLWDLYGNPTLPLGLVPVQSPAAVERLIRRWQKAGIPETFHRAAKRAAQGRIDPGIAEHLGRVRFVPEHNGAEVADLLALAAWSLVLATQRGGLQVRRCGYCQLPWLASERGHYCRRIAKGSQAWLTCREVAKVRDFRARQKGGGS